MKRLLLLILLSWSVVATAENEEPVRQILRAMSGKYALRVVNSPRDKPQLAVEHQYLSAQARAQLKKQIAALPKSGRFANVCMLVENETGEFQRLGVAKLDRRQYREFRAVLPFMKLARFRIAIDLKAAKLTDSAGMLILSEDDLRAMSSAPNDQRSELVQEIETMAVRGRLSFQATLSTLPLSKRKAVATLKTDKGDLGIEVLLDKNMGYTDNDFLILATPSGHELKVPLRELPHASQIVAKLTTRTGMLQRRKIDLSSTKDEFIMEFPEARGEASSLRNVVGAVAVDSAGRAIAPPLSAAWAPTFSVRRIATRGCDFELRYEDAGTTRRLNTFQPFFREDWSRAESAMEFDPEKEEIVLRYSKSAWVTDGVVK